MLNTQQLLPQSRPLNPVHEAAIQPGFLSYRYNTAFIMEREIPGRNSGWITGLWDWVWIPLLENVNQVIFTVPILIMETSLSLSRTLSHN